jgi:hypothetical protein
MANQFYVEIPKQKAELPALIVLGVACFVGWAFHFGIWGLVGGFIWLGLSVPAVFWLYKKRTGKYFVMADEQGISFRLHFFAQFKSIPWKYLQRIDYLVYEINFMLKETAQVVSLATSSLEDAETEALKQYISDAIAKREP